MTMARQSVLSAGSGTPGLDLSFGMTPMQFEKINLLGSELSEHAISSLVLSVQNITVLDLRGNKLNAVFGWQLVKAMKKRYLNLTYCNGVPLRDLRNNAIAELNLSSKDGHQGMYGIEVVGAIFLAHFLRLNSSLQVLNFRRNDVQKDGAKALAQSLLGNPQCQLRTVNTMGASMCPVKPGIDFANFRSSTLTQVNLSRRLLDDDDFVFLEEWLRKYDCVTDLDISNNYICRDGIRKLARYMRDTKMLVKLNCCMLPVDLEGAQQIARALCENSTLEQAAISLGPCDGHPDRLQMCQQLGVGIADHPSLRFFATGKPGPLDYSQLEALREDKLEAYPPLRSGTWPRIQTMVYMYIVAALKPVALQQMTFGSPGKPSKEYPESAVKTSPHELWPSLCYCTRELQRTLVTLSVAMPREDSARAVDLMKVLPKCSALRNLNLLGYATAAIRDSHLPQDWLSTGAAPRWLMDDRVRWIKPNWQALHWLLEQMKQLETFNGLRLPNNLDAPEILSLLLFQCLEGVAADFAEGDGGRQRLVANLQKDANVEAFCDVLRLMSKTPLVIHLTFSDKRVEVVKAQQAKLIKPLSNVAVAEGSTRFTHAVVLRNKCVSEVLLEQVDCHGQLLEFTYEQIEAVLHSLWKALCARERPLPVERINVEPKWLNSCKARKRLDEQQRQELHQIQGALMRSDTFQEIRSPIGEATRSSLAEMELQEFASIMTGITVEDLPSSERFKPHVQWRCYPSLRAFKEPPDEDEEPMLIPLPLNDEAREEHKLQKLSLCMCGLRNRLAQLVRPDEWPRSSRPWWDGPHRLLKPGDWNDAPLEEEEEEERDEEAIEQDDRPCRFHWRPELRIGTHRASMKIAEVMDPSTPAFADKLLHEIIQSLLSEDSSLKVLDLRGNGLTRQDANMLLSLVEKHETLATLNMIPVTVDEANTCSELTMDGAGVGKKADAAKAEGDDDDDPFGDGQDGQDDEEGEAYCREALESQVVRLDEGDGFIFLSLVTPQYFPALHTVVLRHLHIPMDTTLAHLTDALLNLGSVESLVLSELQVSYSGASLLLQAVAEMAPRLSSLNGLPLSRLVQLREASEGAPTELPTYVEWNDFPLGVMARLSLWQVVSFPQDEFKLSGRSLTDVGLRGLCVMLRHFAGQDPGQAPTRALSSGKAGSFVSIARIDLSGNPQISDAAVADLCHTLQHPMLGSSLRHSLRELSVRSCMRLHTRSAFELLKLVNHVREVVRDGDTRGYLGPSLELINGVDVKELKEVGRNSVAGARATGPPMLLRTFVEPPNGSGSARKVELPSLSECDTHFFASMLHHHSQIPYCHLHVVIPSDICKEDTLEGMAPWGRPAPPADDGPFATATVSNDSPFPPPTSSGPAIAAIQAHLDAACRLFEASPIATPLRLSMIPCVPGAEDMLAKGDKQALLLSPDRQPQGADASAFIRIKQKLQERAARKRRGRRQAGELPRPLYVNNINSQRLHCCFRTLYGKDDVELHHEDIMADRSGASLPLEVDISKVFGVATSVDMQHLEIGPLHLSHLPHITEMPVLTHVNLNHNRLGDVGTEILFKALVEAGCSVLHVAVASNFIGDEGATMIALSLGNLPRLTSLELCDNFIQERGSIALAEAVGGIGPAEEEIEEAAPVGPLLTMAVDLRGNRSRELGARRWAEVIKDHPHLRFLNMAQNEIGFMSEKPFLDLVGAAVTSVSLSVLDLQDNFPQPVPVGVKDSGTPIMGPPPRHLVEELLAELPSGEFDYAEVQRAVLIRRHRGGGGAGPGPSESRGRQPQQGPAGSGPQRHGGSHGKEGAASGTTP